MTDGMKAILKTCGVIIALCGTIYYSLALLAWVLLIAMAIRDATPTRMIEWNRFTTALAAPLLLYMSIMTIRYREKSRLQLVTILAALTIAVIWSWYDGKHGNYQIGTHSNEFGWEQYHVPGNGARHIYVNWPWLGR